MRSIRLYADIPLHAGAERVLPAGPAAHAVRVLRLAAGDPVILFNGDGHEYPAQLVVASAREVRARITACESPQRESSLRVTLVQALARGEKMDWIVQKATELGVARIVPVATERSEVKLDAERATKRLEHWRAIAIAACEQSGRTRVPVIDPPQALAHWLSTAAGDAASMRLMMCVDDAALRLRDCAIASEANLAIAIGPEGGFGETDLAALRAQGYRAITLGPRVLRTESAGLAAIAALQALAGDA